MADFKGKKSLADRCKEFGASLPFMEGREKGDVKSLVGQVITLREYGFLKEGGDDNREYICFTVDEHKGEFYFGGTVLTDQIMQLDKEGYGESIEEEGLSILLTAKKSKNKREYINVEFNPE